MKERSANSEFNIPRVKPPIRALRSDDSGRIWVEVYVESEKRTTPSTRSRPYNPAYTWRERTTYDLISPAGRYLGRLQLPWESKLLTIRGDRVYLLTRGSEGEDRIGVYEIRRQEPGASLNRK